MKSWHQYSSHYETVPPNRRRIGSKVSKVFSDQKLSEEQLSIFQMCGRGKKSSVFSKPSSMSRHDHSKDPVMVRHLKVFRFFGGTPLTLEVGRFSQISKPFLAIFGVFLAWHLIYYCYHLTELESSAPFSTALGVFRRSVFALGPAYAMYKVLKNRTTLGKALDELYAIQRVFGVVKYKLFFSIKLYAIITAIVSTYRLGMGAALIYTRGSPGEAIKRVQTALLAIYNFANVASFTYTVKCISACFQHLSDWGLKDKVDEPSIRRYVKIYTHLVAISEEINAHFDPFLSFMMLASFLNFMDVSSDLMTDDDLGWSDVIWKVFKFGVYLAQVLLVVTTCQSASERADNCNEVLYSRLIQQKTLPVENNIHSFVVMHLGAEKTVQYLLCESFPINYNLAISMAAAYVTYITVMFQLDHDNSRAETASGNNTDVNPQQ